MKLKIVCFVFFVCLCEYDVRALSFPGPRVYVVTPAPRTLRKDEGKPTPFYYHNWMRRMDTGPDTSTTTTTTKESSTPKVKTPDLIFAEFESKGSLQKSIRKLLEKEKIPLKKTTMSPIYIPDEEENKVTRVVNYGLPVKTSNYNENSTERIKYSYIPQNDYYNNVPAPVYLTDKPTTMSTTTQTISTTTASPISVENIWHVIDDEKSNQYSNKWEEISFKPKNEKNPSEEEIGHKQKNGDVGNHGVEGDDNSYKQEYNDDELAIDDHFALPGFATNPGNGAENESRAIRTEQNIRFPYINLKPFQIKPPKKTALYNLSNSKKSHLLTSLDNFYDIKHPVRGEAQDTVPLSQPIDRYNPAQPYLPQQKYGGDLSKQSYPVSTPLKATGTLVPPPPLPPKSSGNDFPAPISYESFPPYAPSGPDFGPLSTPVQAPSPPVSPIKPEQSIDLSSALDTSGLNTDDSGPTMDTSYRYKPPSDMEDNNSGAAILNTGYQYKPPTAPIPQFYPTPVPQVQPFQGYSYSKPGMTSDTMPMTVAEKPDFQGYHYNKPSSKPVDYMPPSYGPSFTYGQDHFPTDSSDDDHSPPHVFGHDATPIYGHDSDGPEITYDNKPYEDVKGVDDMKDDMGMKPPALNTDTKPYGPSMDDHGFPSDFPSDFKFSPDMDDHDHGHEHYYYHDHTTTTTTEMPRVNRFSYYYLGKKLYYLPLYFSVYFIIYVGALIIKAVLRHKIVYPNSWRPNTTTAGFFSKRSVDEYLSHENLHELTKRVTQAIATAAEKYMSNNK